MATNVPQNGYNTGMNAPARAQGRTNGLAIAALVLGIVGIIDFGFLWGVAGLLALIFGFIALRQIRTRGQAGRGMAITGIVLGAIGLIWGIVGNSIGVSILMHH